MYNLTFLSIANRDIQNIVSYYDDINSTLSDVFLKEMEDTKSFILQNPDACPKRIRNIRVSYLKRFRYGVFFKIYEDEIIVIAVLHTSRNPEIWQKR